MPEHRAPEPPPLARAGIDRAADEYTLGLDDTERARGLMFRDTLADGTGMLFIHEAEEPQAYWMKNTRIPAWLCSFPTGRMETKS